MEIDISLSQLKKTYNSYFNSTEQEYQASKSKSKSVDLHKDEPSYINLTPKIEHVKSISNLNEMDEMDSMANETGEEGRNPNDQTTLLPTQNSKNVSSDKSSQQSLMTGVNNNNNPMNEMEETDNEIDNNNDNNNTKDNNNCIENKHEDESKNEKSMNKEEEEEDVMEMNDMAPSWAFDTLEEEIEYLRNVNLRLRYELEVSNANTNQSSSLASALAGVGGRGYGGGGCDGNNDDDSKLELKIQNNDLTHKLNKDKKVSFAMNKAFLNNAKISPYEFSQRVQSKLPQFLRNEENNSNNNNNGNGKVVSNIDDTTNKDTIYIPSMIENEIGIIDIKHVDWWDIIDYDSIDCDDDYLKSNLNNTIDGQNTSDQMVFNNGVALDGPFVLVRV